MIHKKIQTIGFKERIKSLHLGRYSTVIGLAVLIGLLAGLANIVFRSFQAYIPEVIYQELYDFLEIGKGGYHQYFLPLLPMLGVAMLIPFALHYGSNEVYGYGFSRFLENVNIKGGIVKARTIYLKTIAPALTIGMGGSAGIEGPIAQIGGAVGSNIGRMFRFSGERIKLYIASGSAGAVAAIFNAPITGVMFAIEIVLIGHYEMSSFMAIIISSGVATVVSRAWPGETHAFHVPEYELVTPVELVFYIALGLIVGLLSVVYIKVFHAIRDSFMKSKINVHIKPMIGALFVGIIAIFFPQVMGNGYEFIEKALLNDMAMGIMFVLIFLKILATSFTLGSGGAGGVFAPALFVGAMIGGSFGVFIHDFFPSITAEPGAYATVGVGSFLAAVTHAPLTGIFLLFEMTGNYEIIIPVMIASIVGALVSKVINYDSIDTVELSRKGIDLHGGNEKAIMASLKVREVMDRSFQTIHENKDLNDLTELILMGKSFYFPVVNDEGKLVGIISLQDIKGALFEEDLRDIVKVGNASSKKVYTIKPSDDLQKAIEFLTKRDIKEIPVVSDDDERLVIGMLRRDDIMGAYQKEVLKRKVEGFI